MEAQFVDRILTCVDCRSEFVFTAGEQLFFFDKQFKNDPKRCKPCKSRRSGLTAAANGTGGPVAAGISRTETRTECSECGVQTTVPFKPTQGRPVLCRQCFQVKSKSAPAAVVTPVAIPSTTLIETAPVMLSATLAEPTTTSETVTALTAASANKDGQMLSREAAQRAVATMAAASPESSVATVADLVSILATAEPAVSARGISGTAIPALLAAAAQGESATTGVALIAEPADSQD